VAGGAVDDLALENEIFFFQFSVGKSIDKGNNIGVFLDLAVLALFSCGLMVNETK